MKVAAFEEVVDHGAVRLPSNVDLPDKTRVFVVFPEVGDREPTRILSPRLVNTEQASDFKKEILGEPPDAESQ